MEVKEIMRRIDATIYFGSENAQESTTVWVDENATDEDIRYAIAQEALQMIEIEYREIYLG